MADPITIMAVGGMAASAAGSGVSAMGAAYSGSAQANMYNYQAGVARLNKQIADQNASYEVALGEQRAQKVAIEGAAKTATITAGAGASGLDIASGSKAEVIASSEKIAQYSEAVTRSDAARRAYGYEVQATGFEAQAALDTSAARTARTASEFQVASSIIGGVGSVATRWQQGIQTGVFPNSFGTS